MRRLLVVAVLGALAFAGCTTAPPEESTEEPTPSETPTPTSSPTGEPPLEAGDVPLVPVGAPAEATPTPTTPAAAPADPVAQPTPAPAPTTPTPAEPTPAAPTPAAPSPTPPATPTPSPTPVASPTPPPATPAPTPAPAAWPREGSFVTYRMSSGASCPDGCWYERTHANATWTYRGGDWVGTCEAQRTDWWESNGTYHNTTERVTYSAASPPHWPPFDTTRPPAEGELVKAWYLDGCDIDWNDWDVRYRGEDTETVGGTSLPTYLATTDETGEPRDHRTEWLQGSGLVVYARMQWHYSHASIALVATDAPR